jgi:hypothetical protein
MRFVSADPHWTPYNAIYGDNPARMPSGGLLPNIHAIKQSANVYSFALNNPVRFIDSSGLFVTDVVDWYAINYNTGIDMLMGMGTGSRLFANYSLGVTGTIRTQGDSLVYSIADVAQNPRDAYDSFMRAYIDVLVDPYGAAKGLAVGVATGVYDYFHTFQCAVKHGDWDSVAYMLGSATVVVGEVALGKAAYNKVVSLQGSGSWSMRRGGDRINGRRYTEHALERMAPDTPAVRAELHTRAIQRAQAQGLKPGTAAYNKFINDQINPRGIPPMVVEDAIRNTRATRGRSAGTFVHQTSDITVIVNRSGDVITVMPR